MRTDFLVSLGVPVATGLVTLPWVKEVLAGGGGWPYTADAVISVTGRVIGVVFTAGRAPAEVTTGVVSAAREMIVVGWG